MTISNNYSLATAAVEYDTKLIKEHIENYVIHANNIFIEFQQASAESEAVRKSYNCYKGIHKYGVTACGVILFPLTLLAWAAAPFATCFGECFYLVHLAPNLCYNLGSSIDQPWKCNLCNCLFFPEEGTWDTPMNLGRLNEKVRSLESILHDFQAKSEFRNIEDINKLKDRKYSDISYELTKYWIEIKQEKDLSELLTEVRKSPISFSIISSVMDENFFKYMNNTIKIRDACSKFFKEMNFPNDVIVSIMLDYVVAHDGKHEEDQNRLLNQKMSLFMSSNVSCSII